MSACSAPMAQCIHVSFISFPVVRLVNELEKTLHACDASPVDRSISVIEANPRADGRASVFFITIISEQLGEAFAVERTTRKRV